MITPLGKKVLLVDDEVAVRNVFQLSLERSGMCVFTANGAAEALRSFHSFQFDAVIIEIRLEDGGSIDLLRHIKKLRPETRTIAISACPRTPELKQSLRSARVDVFHSKLDPIAKLIDSL